MEKLVTVSELFKSPTHLVISPISSLPETAGIFTVKSLLSTELPIASDIFVIELNNNLIKNIIVTIAIKNAIIIV